VNVLRNEKECKPSSFFFSSLAEVNSSLDLVWDGIAEDINALVSTWWDDMRTVGLLNAFLRVYSAPYRDLLVRMLTSCFESRSINLS